MIVTKPTQPRPLNEVERAQRRKRIARVAKRRGLVDVAVDVDEVADGSIITTDDSPL